MAEYSANVELSLLAGLLLIYFISFLSIAVTIGRLIKIAQFSSIWGVYNVNQRIEISYFGVIEIMTIIMSSNLPALPAGLRHVQTTKARKTQDSGQWLYHVKDWLRSRPASGSDGASNGMDGSTERRSDDDASASQTSMNGICHPIDLDYNGSKSKAVVELDVRQFEPSSP